ncbi:MAG: hypothetical protein J2P17_31800, partial [Mycobacterium sp.]|nr:hypothetical protein [Mycobacterium sp.]
MDLKIPSELQWVAFLAGSQWPLGSESGMWRIAEHLRSHSGDLAELIPDLQRVRSEVPAVLWGETAQAVDRQFAMLFDGDYSAEKLVDALRSIADLAENLGTEIQYTKLQIITTLAIAAGTIIWALANSQWTGGSSLAWIPFIERLTQNSVVKLVSAALGRVEAALASKLGSTMVPRLLAEGAVSAMIGAGQELGIEGVQAAEGQRDGLDIGKALHAAFSMGVASVAGGLVGSGVGELLGQEGNTAARAVKGVVTGLSSGAAAGVAGTVADGGDVTPETLAQAFLGGAIGFVHGGVQPGGGHGSTSGPGAAGDEHAPAGAGPGNAGVGSANSANQVAPQAGTASAGPAAVTGDRAGTTVSGGGDSATKPSNGAAGANDSATGSSNGSTAGGSPPQADVGGQGTRSPNGTPAEADSGQVSADVVEPGVDPARAMSTSVDVSTGREIADRSTTSPSALTAAVNGNARPAVSDPSAPPNATGASPVTAPASRTDQLAAGQTAADSSGRNPSPGPP